MVVRLHVVLADTGAAGHDVIRSAFGPYLATDGYNALFRRLGFVAEMDALEAAFAAGDRKGVAAAMTADVCEAVGVVGPLDHVRSRVRAYAEAGADVIAINPIAPDPAAQLASFRALVGSCT